MSKVQRNVTCLKTISLSSYLPIHFVACSLYATMQLPVVGGNYSTMLAVWSHLEPIPPHEGHLLLPSNQFRFPCYPTHHHTVLDS